MSTGPGPAPAGFVRRFRLVTCCLVLVAVAFAQRPGSLVSDTKLDLVVAPGSMLERSLYLWDPEGGFGQVQNQAYGYLFPMGSFFWVGDLLDLPGWVVQRSWWALLLVVAFLGVVKLCGVLGIGSPLSRVLAGFAYALSPRILTTLGPISIEAWPSAVVPWVLVPLVVGSSRGSPFRAAALSALAVALTGGVNAAATFAVVPLGVLWLLTREPGPRRRALMLWWPVLVAAGTAWWVVPLLLLGRYSPPFLDFIETASITTFPTTVVDALRGTSHWVPYVDSSWQAGNDLLTTTYVLLDIGVLVTLGLAGLAVRSNPHRQFLVFSLLLGLVVVTAGHGGALSGWFDGTLRSALDGALAPLRNVHKFDPWIRLPLVLGLAHLLTRLPTRRTDGAPGGGDRVLQVGVVAATVVALVGSASPVLAGRLAPTDAFEGLPGYWEEAAGWLDREGGDGVALLVPGSSFGTFSWGTPEDEPLQPLAGSRWAVRNAVPLAPPGNIRMLDAVEERLATGRPSAGLAPFLRRAGIEHLVVRNDLRRGADVPEPALVHQALEGSPGISQVAAFGPASGGRVRLLEEDEDGGASGGRELSDVVLGDGWEGRYRPVEIYAVGAEGDPGTARVGGPTTVVGGPEDLLPLTDAGLLGWEPTVLATDAEGPEGPLLLTDGLRRREANFARLHNGRSATLTADDVGRRGSPARDYLVGSSRWETYARILGARSLTASSSRAFADTDGPVRPETLPFAAFDGLVDTGWDSGPVGADERAWLEVGLEEPTPVDEVTVVVADSQSGGAREPRAFRVRTDGWVSDVQGVAPGEATTVTLPGTATSVLRVEAADRGEPLALAEVRVPGVDLDRTLVMPEVPAPWGAPDGILLDAGDGQTRGCVEVGGDVRCAAGREGRGEEPGFVDRTLRLGTGADYTVGVTARPVSGPALLGLVQRDLFVTASASSSVVTDPRASAFAAVDGAPGTAWTASSDDDEPTLSVRWLGERRISGLGLSLDDQAAASPVRRVRLEFPGGNRAVEVDEDGEATFRPFTATEVDVVVLDTDRVVSRRPDGSDERLPAGIGELRLTGLGLLPVELSDVPVDHGCAYGPTVRVGTALYATSVVASPRQLAAGEDVAARLCGPTEVRLPSGSTRVVLAPAPAFRPVRATFRQAGVTGAVNATAADPGNAEVEWVDDVTRQVSLVAEDTERVLTLAENANPGWEAADGSGRALRPVTVDGWQQGWVVPAGTSAVTVAFGPDGLYRAALLGGGLLLLTLAVLALGLGRAGRLRRWPDAVGTRPLPGGAVVLVGAAALGVVAGWAGAAAVFVAAALARALDGRVTGAVATVVGVVPVAVATALASLRPWGSDDGWAGVLLWPQLLAVLGVAWVCAVGAGSLLPRSFNRRAGRSTSR